MPRTAAQRPSRGQTGAGAAQAAPPPAQQDSGPAAGRNPRNLYERAHEAIELHLVTCRLQPGRHLALPELQDMVRLGRTPVHQAVTRLAQDTLLRVHPRRGLQVAPIDLARERVLLRLRRDMERFVIRLAAQKSGASQRNQMLHIKRQLHENRAQLTIDDFNPIDLRIDRLFLAAAGEPFVENTLRPLHTLFRRIGWLYHSLLAPGDGMAQTIDVHLALLDAVVHCDVERAIAASDALIDYVDRMFDPLEREIDPALLDCSLGDFALQR